tara:strand:+ start:77 stop:1267 length:1191 start_codon:yes stop_codon:yes gene_type:complete
MPRYTILKRDRREPGRVYFAKRNNPSKVYSIADGNLSDRQIDKSIEDGYMASLHLRSSQDRNQKRFEKDYEWRENRDVLSYTGEDSRNSFRLSGAYGSKVLPETVRTNMYGVPRDIKRALEKEHDSGRKNKKIRKMAQAFRDAEDMVQTADGFIAADPPEAASLLDEARERLRDYPQVASTRSGRRVLNQLNVLRAQAQRVDASGGMTVNEITVQVERTKGMAARAEARRKQKYEEILESGGERIRDRMARWMLLRKKPEYIARAEAGLEDAKAMTSKAKASRLKEQNEIAKQRGKGRYVGTREAVKLQKAVAKEELMGTMLARRQISYEQAQLKRKRQAAAAAEYFQRRLVEQEARRLGRRGQMITAENVREWENLAKVSGLKTEMSSGKFKVGG